MNRSNEYARGACAENKEKKTCNISILRFAPFSVRQLRKIVNLEKIFQSGTNEINIINKSNPLDSSIPFWEGPFWDGIEKGPDIRIQKRFRSVNI
jgi:hypothetical protein